MTKTSFIFKTWIGLFLCLFTASCSDDDSNPKEKEKEDTGLSINHWIDENLRKDYLWYNELPATNKIDYTADPETFFQSLLSSKDGKTRNGEHHYYSYMEKNKNYKTRTTIDADDTYGMEFVLYTMVDPQSSQPLGFYYARILYVLPDSPAERAELKRGDWIMGINGKDNIKVDNYKSLWNGSAARWTVSPDLKTETVVNIEASTTVDDNPLYLHKVLPIGENKRIGYLVYNHFTPGPTDENDRAYDEEMKTIFAYFQSQQVNEFVLDLRYNGGGYVHSANMLAGLLVPEAYKKEVFAFLSNNKDKVTQTRYFNTETKGEAGYLNLNSNTIYILTSENTASSSELVISSLMPFMNVVLIGELTEGKNVGMQMYSDEKYEWRYWPITTKVANAKKADYSAGFKPDHDWSEFNRAQNTQDTFLPLGDPDEFMLSKAIELITEGYQSTRSKTTASQTKQRERSVFYQSTERHATGGVLLCPTE